MRLLPLLLLPLLALAGATPLNADEPAEDDSVGEALAILDLSLKNDDGLGDEMPGDPEFEGPLFEFVDHEDDPACVAFTPDGAFVISGDGTGTILIWNVNTGSVITELVGHTDAVVALALSQDGNSLLSSGWDETVRLWDISTGEQDLQLKGGKPFTEHVPSLAFLPDERHVLLASYSGAVNEWDLETDTLTRALTGHTANVMDVDVDADGTFAATASYDNTVRCWDLESGNEIWKQTEPTDVMEIAIAPNGQMVASGDGQGHVKILELETGTLLTECMGHSDWIGTLAWDPDSNYLFSSSAGEGVPMLVHAADGGDEMDIFEDDMPGALAEDAAWSPDSSTIAIACRDGVVHLWGLYWMSNDPEFQG